MITRPSWFVTYSLAYCGCLDELSERSICVGLGAWVVADLGWLRTGGCEWLSILADCLAVSTRLAPILADGLGGSTRLAPILADGREVSARLALILADCMEVSARLTLFLADSR